MQLLLTFQSTQISRKVPITFTPRNLSSRLSGTNFYRLLYCQVFYAPTISTLLEVRQNVCSDRVRTELHKEFIIWAAVKIINCVMKSWLEIWRATTYLRFDSEEGKNYLVFSVMRYQLLVLLSGPSRQDIDWWVDIWSFHTVILNKVSKRLLFAPTVRNGGSLNRKPISPPKGLILKASHGRDCVPL